MYRFEHPTYLFTLFLIPLLVGLYFYTQKAKKKALLRLGDSHLIERLIPNALYAFQKNRFYIFLSALVFLIIAWANPQKLGNTQQETTQKKVTDIIIALDVSNSMLATDVQPNRLERARLFALDLVEQMKTERIGFIIFAGNAYMQTPLTVDFKAVSMFIKSANPEQAPTQGTAIGEAVDLAEKDFLSDKTKSQRIMIIISDGEDHDSEALHSVKQAREKGLLLFTVGVGKPEGGYMPDAQNPQDYKRDEQGNPIKTVLNENLMRELAENGGGVYYNISNTLNVIPALKSYIDKAQKRDLEIYHTTQDYDSYFQWFLLPAILLLIWEFMFLPKNLKKPQ